MPEWFQVSSTPISRISVSVFETAISENFHGAIFKQYKIWISTEGLGHVTGKMGWLLAHKPWLWVPGAAEAPRGWLVVPCIWYSLEVLPQRVKSF